MKLTTEDATIEKTIRKLAFKRNSAVSDQIFIFSEKKDTETGRRFHRYHRRMIRMLTRKR